MPNQRRVGVPVDPNETGIVVDAGEGAIDLNAPLGVRINGAPLSGAYSPTGHTHSGAYVRQGRVESTVSGAVTVNPATADFQAFVLTGNVTFTFSAGTVTGQRLLLQLIQDGTGSRLVTWPGGGGFQFAGGAAPTLSTGAWVTDFIELVFLGGSSWKEINRCLAVP